MHRLLIALLFVFYVGNMFAQTEEAAPIYNITLTGQGITEDGRQIEVSFGVTNIGGASSLTTRAELITFDNNGQPRVVASADVRPLGGNTDREIITLRADISQFTPGIRQPFSVQIASLPGQPAITSNARNLAIDIPQDAGQVSEPSLTIPGLNLNLDLSERDQTLVIIGIVASTLLLLMLVYVLLRLIFKRSPDFKTVWQPPYATVPPLDPYSAAGIRQSWQALAQNNLIISPPAPGAYQIVKLLLGMDGRYLSGWQPIAMRLIQYDQYGRVARTETLANNRMMRTIERLVSRSGTLPREKLLRRVQPIARKLTAQFSKKITPRSAMLPVALDLRFRGIHGEVNIVFELYRWENTYWQLVDRWQPEMMIMGKALQESYTYSLYGQTGGESAREFRKRLANDLARMLVEMIGAKPPEVQPAVPATVPAPPDTATNAVVQPGE
jgi:hypothetical protein